MPLRTLKTLALYASLLASVIMLLGLVLLERELRQLTDEARLLAREVRLSSPSMGQNKYTDVRQFVVRSALSQVKNPILFIGDSITAAAVLPSEICGHDVLNGGIGGATAMSYLNYAKEIFENEHFPLVVVALGTNDSQNASPEPPAIATPYRELLDYIAAQSDHILIAGLPPIDMSGSLAKPYFNPSYATANNHIIRAEAERRDIHFIDLQAAIPSGQTVDGIHISGVGYEAWTRAILSAVSDTVCDKDWTLDNVGECRSHCR